MTIDETIDMLYCDDTEVIEEHLANYQKCAEEHRQLAEWLKDYKRLLEQEPCENAISRQSAISLASDLKQDLPDDEHMADMVMAHNEGILEYQTQLSLIPSVTPQPKTGQWIERRSRATGHIESVCSECGAEEGYPYNDYCGNCGAKMESEDKE